MNKLRSALVCLLALPVLGQAVETDPAGFVTVSLAGNSDSYVYIPFKRSPAFVGMATTLTANGTYDLGEPFTDTSGDGVWQNGEVFTDTSNVINLAGTPGLTGNQFVYASGSQPNRYYAFLKSGTRAGMYYSVVSNGTAAVVVDTAGDDLSAAITGTTTLEVIPYDTLATIFPAGASVHASASHSIAVRNTEILIPNLSSSGTDLASAVSYYYFSGVSGPGAGWRKAGFTAVLANDDVLLPDTFFIVRHNIATDTSLTFTGTVQMNQLATPLGTIAASTDQDNAAALPFATELTLAQLKLFESGAFAGSSSHSIALRQDQVLVWDNSVVGKNKSAATSYYYFTGASGVGPGWRESGITGTLANNAVVIGPNKGIIIRKKSGGTPSTALWTVKPPYVP
ncbi:MAG: TIGR02597 family protein [Prosthecobacter sp.]